MKQNYYYFDPSQRNKDKHKDKEHISRSEYTRKLFAKIIKMANNLGETKRIEGNFYENELRFVLNNFSLAPSSRKTGKIPKTYYCIFEINPSTANN